MTRLNELLNDPKSIFVFDAWVFNEVYHQPYAHTDHDKGNGDKNGYYARKEYRKGNNKNNADYAENICGHLNSGEFLFYDLLIIIIHMTKVHKFFHCRNSLHFLRYKVILAQYIQIINKFFN